jgi:hypothetical protein
VAEMAKYSLSQSQLEAVCLGALTNRVFAVQAVSVVPFDPRQPNGSWEISSLDPLPTADSIEAVIEVSRDLQRVFSLKFPS